MWANTLRLSFGTIAHGKADYAATLPAAKTPAIAYPKSDGALTYDRLSSVFVSNTLHEEDQPIPPARARHDRCKKPPSTTSTADPRDAYCPAGVYEWIEEGEGRAALPDQTRPTAFHCKTCDIKDPKPEHRLDPAGGRRRARTIRGM